MILTEREATQKTCPLSIALGSTSCCLGSSCMSWRYTVPPKLELRRTLTVERVAQLVDTGPVDLEIDYLVINQFMRESLHNRAVLSVLASVTPDWVCSEGPAYDEDETLLYAKFSRAFADKAVGYCGMAPIYMQRNEA